MEETNEMEQELMAAERAVSEAKEKLVAELEAASENGRQAIERVVERARPMALAAAAVAGVAVLAGTAVLVRKSFSRRRVSYWTVPERRSVLGEAARKAFVSAAATLATALARRALTSLEVLPAESSGEAPAEKVSNGRAVRSKRERAAKQSAQ